MIYNSSSEKDLDLKLRYMRILWNLGYCTRKNIELARFDTYGRDRNYTDIDVFGIKFDDELNSNIIVGDCKSGRSAKSPERIFWLSGVMSAVNANRGVFIRNSFDEIRYNELAKNLSIELLSAEHLNRLENIYDINAAEFFGPFNEENDISLLYLKKLKSINKNIYEYISIKYWLGKPHEQIATLISCCNKIKMYTDLDEKTRSFLLSYIYSLLAISLLKFSKSIFYISDNHKENMIEQYLMGGLEEYIHKINLLSSFYNFMVKEIAEKYREHYPIGEEQFIEGLNPYYLKYLKDLVLRICDKPKAAKHLPQLIDVFTYEILHEGKKYDKEIVSIDGDYSDITNILKNYIAFIERTDIITSEIKSRFEEFVVEFGKK